jgi:hypothetical protein
MQALDDIGNPDAPYGSREWCSAMRLHIQNGIDEAKSRVSHIRFSLKSTRDEAHFVSLQDKDGNKFSSWEDFCQYPRPWGLGFSVEVANAIIEERNGDRLISCVAADTMARAQPLKANGGDRRSAEAKDQVDNIKLKHKGGTDPEYLAARIKRDHPDIAQAVERGEYRSMRQAALAAGIVKQSTPLDTLRRAWAKASEDERAAFRDEIDKPVMDRRFG